jgi:fatty acid desaturase
VSFAGLTFLGHETLHGGTVRGRRVRHLVGWIAFLPFVLSPRLWMVWHNREHHGHTNHSELDPDRYPSLPVYNGSRVVRVVTDSFSLGARRWTGVLSLLFGFTGQSSKILLDAHARGWMSKTQHRLALGEAALGIALWATVAWLVGPLGFVFVFVLPLIVANWIVMAFILTNHSLNPITDVNDPLVNSLSVTVPRLCEWVSLGFGYHVEHHLFPAMSTRHGPRLRALLLERWPERYQSMPLGQALLALHRTARVYRDPVTLTDPRSGAVWPALLPRDPA